MPAKRHDDTHGAEWTSDVRPAPGDLRIVQAFLNTVARRKHYDEIAGPQALADWLTRWRLLPKGTELAAGAAERALTLRSALRALVVADQTGTQLKQGVLERLHAVTAEAPLALRLTSDRAVRFEPVLGGLEGALGELLAIVARTRFDGLWVRMKVCGAADCRRVFYDYASNRLSRWCTKLCGDRVNAKLHRRRKAAKGA